MQIFSVVLSAMATLMNFPLFKRNRRPESPVRLLLSLHTKELTIWGYAA